MKKELFIDCCSFLFVMLFAYTALSKFLNYDLFLFQMRRAPLSIMQAAAPILGWAVPAIEALLVVSLLIRRFQLKGLIAAVALLLTFEIYITAMLLTNQHLPCTCGGIISTMTWNQHLIFNAVFIVIGLTAIFQIKNYHFFRTGKINKELSRA